MGLNTYYKTIVKKLEGTKFDGSQDFQILAKINTKATNGTIFAHAFPSKWGAKWESGGKDGQGKMLFIRGGKLAFDIGWTGYVGGKTIINDGKDHKIGINFKKATGKFCLYVDGKMDGCGLKGVKDRDGAEFLIGVSVGHDARRVASMAPIFRGKIWDFRVNLKLNKPDDFEVAIKKQVEDPPAKDGSDGSDSVTTVTTEIVKEMADDGTETVKITKPDGSTETTVTTSEGIKTVKTTEATIVTTVVETKVVEKVIVPEATTVYTPPDEDGNDDTPSTEYTVKKVKQADGTIVEETVYEGEVEEETDEQVQKEVAVQIDEVETLKETAGEATKLAEKLVKETIVAETTAVETEKEEVNVEEEKTKAEEEEADAQLEEENADVEIAEEEDKAEKTDDVIKKADIQERIDAARERRRKIIIWRKRVWERRRLAWQRYHEIRKRNAAAKALLMRIKWAKLAAERARKNADKALKAKTDRLNAKLRQQKMREKIQAQRRKNIQKLNGELCARTENNEEDAKEIWETAKEVEKNIKDFNEAGKTNDLGYKTTYVGCFRDRGKRDLPVLFGKYKKIKRADCLAEAKKKNFKYIGHQYGGECWMSNAFGKYGQVDDSECKMKCALEPNLICGGGWRNSVWSVEQYDPQEARIKEAKEVNEGVKGIIKDINEARKHTMTAHRLAKQLAWITGGDLRYLQHAKNLGLK